MSPDAPARLASEARQLWRAAYHARRRVSQFAAVNPGDLRRFAWSDGGGSYSLVFARDMQTAYAVTDGEIYRCRVSPVTLTPETREEILKCPMADGLSGWMASDFPEFKDLDTAEFYIWIVGDTSYLCEYL